MLSILEVTAILVRDPYELRPWEILRLNRWLIRHVYFHPVDEQGNVEIRPKGGPVNRSEEEEYRAFGRSWGWPDWFIAERWKRQQERQQKEKGNGRKS